MVPLEAPSGIHEERPVEPREPDVARDDVVGSDAPIPEPVVVTLPTADRAPHEPIRVGGMIEPPRRVFSVPPVYPPIARAAHVEGVVILEAIIDEEGRVRQAKPLKSLALLNDAAIDAVRQWRFTPTLLNGQPVAVVMTVTVIFSLR